MNAVTPTSPAAANDTATPKAAWLATALLAFMYWLSVLDRTIISLLVDPIKHDLGITDVQFSMLHGLAFAVTFSIFGLAAGTLADRFNRRRIIFLSVSIWSLATAACGMAQNFTHMLIARVGVGAGEAGLNPCATSMITDLFPRSKLTLAMAVYALGASVGSGCAYLFGGMLIDAVSRYDSIALPLVGTVSPWQAVFYLIGIPGIFIAFLIFLIPEPIRRDTLTSPREQQPLFTSFFSGYRGLLGYMRLQPKFYLYHYLGFGTASMAFVGGAAWYPAHMSRAFGWGSTEIGLSLGIMLVAAGLLGNLLCGYGVGYLYKRGFKDAQLRWYAGCLLLALPCGLVALTSANPIVFLAGISLFLLLLSPVTALYVSSMNLVTPNELRGAGVAFYSATVGLLALSLGPILIAVFSEIIFGGNAIGKGMALVIGLCCPVASALLMLGCKPMREAATDFDIKIKADTNVQYK